MSLSADFAWLVDTVDARVVWVRIRVRIATWASVGNKALEDVLKYVLRIREFLSIDSVFDMSLGCMVCSTYYEKGKG